MRHAYVPGAPPTARQRAAAARRAMRRRVRTVHAALARVVARLSDRQLERAPLGPLVAWSLPFVLRLQFRPEYSVDLDGTDIEATMLLNLRRDGDRRCDRFEIAIRRRRCRIRRLRGEPAGRPDATLNLVLSDVMRVSVGAVDPLELVSNGRSSISGDTFLAVRVPGMFRQPTRAVI